MTTPRCHIPVRPARQRRHAGFAMPLVILLALVVGIVAAVVLQRQAAQGYIVERQFRSYRNSHFERGLREVVSAWTDTLVGQPLSNLIGPDGHTLDIELPNESWASIYLFDGQGSLVGNAGGLSEQQRIDMSGVLDAIDNITGGEVDLAWFRPVGPVRVSLMSAPPEVLEAIAAYAGARSPRRFVSAIEEARLAGEMTQADLETAYNRADLNAEERAVINRLVALQPELWAMIVEVYQPLQPGRPAELITRYLGRFSLPAAGAARGGTSLSSLGKFLSWEELPQE